MTDHKKPCDLYENHAGSDCKHKPRPRSPGAHHLTECTVCGIALVKATGGWQHLFISVPGLPPEIPLTYTDIVMRELAET